MNVLIMTDQEGVAGYVSFDHDQGSRNNEQGKHLLTGEVNAAVDGLLEAGAKDILVLDGHGAGAVHYPDLHDAARLLHGRPLGPRSEWDKVMPRYDVTMIIGQHAMAGVQTGNLHHTQSSQSIDYYKLNKRPIGEIAQWALYAGSFDIPLIFLSGDDAACKEVRALVPAVTTAAVKSGLGRNSAISLSHNAACRLIQQGAKSALEKHRAKPVPPLHWKGPYVLEKRFFHTDSVDAHRDMTDVEIVDSQTIRLRSRNIRDIIYR